MKGKRRGVRGEGRGVRCEGRGAKVEERGTRGEGQGARGERQACSSARSFHLAREARGAAEATYCTGSWGTRCGSKGTAGAVAIVSVVRTGMAWSSLECWLFILSAVAWARGVGVGSASHTQAAVRRLWGKVASATRV